MVRTFQITKALARMPVIDNMMLAAPDQPGEQPLQRRLPPAAVREREREVRERAMELLEVFELERLADDYAGTLSGGQRKLLEFARALMTEPTMLLLDEPMAGINPTLGARLLEHMQRPARAAGMTFLFIEHDMEVVMGHSDRVIVMAEGRVIADGPPEEVRRDQRVIDAYLGAVQRVGPESLAMSGNGAMLATEDLVAGYVPEVDILNGVTIDVARGRDRHRRRPQRRRQVDADQDDLRPAEAARRAAILFRGRGHHRREAPHDHPHAAQLRSAARQRLPEPDGRGEPRGGLARPLAAPASRSTTCTSSFPRLGERRRQAAGTMSGGERQMVAMARALMPDPQVLLLDEPSAGLAPAFVDAIFEKVADVNRAGVTIVMVEQNARRALAMSDRGYVLDLGKNAFRGHRARSSSRREGRRALPRRHGPHRRPSRRARRTAKRPGRRAPAVSLYFAVLSVALLALCRRPRLGGVDLLDRLRSRRS